LGAAGSNDKGGRRQRSIRKGEYLHPDSRSLVVIALPFTDKNWDESFPGSKGWWTGVKAMPLELRSVPEHSDNFATWILQPGISRNQSAGAPAAANNRHRLRNSDPAVFRQAERLRDSKSITDRAQAGQAALIGGFQRSRHQQSDPQRKEGEKGPVAKAADASNAQPSDFGTGTSKQRWASYDSQWAAYNAKNPLGAAAADLSGGAVQQRYTMNGKEVSEADAKAAATPEAWAAIKGGQTLSPGESYSSSGAVGQSVPVGSGNIAAAPAAPSVSAVAPGKTMGDAVAAILKRLDALVSALSDESKFLQNVLS
jgi:hypothetical protein